MFDKNLRLVAVDKETQECYTVDSIHFPLGKPSGKDIAVISNDDYDLLEWRSIDEVDMYQIKSESVEALRKEYEILLRRFRHLLKSEIIALYDEVDPRTKKYKRDIKELDNFIYKIASTYPPVK